MNEPVVRAFRTGNVTRLDCGSCHGRLLLREDEVVFSAWIDQFNTFLTTHRPCH